MTEAIDDAIDALLRDQFDGPVPDHGFSDRVLARLPARRRRANWPVAAGAVLGAALCWYCLSLSPLASLGSQDWVAGRLSAPAVTLLLAIVGLAILLVAWAMVEADDRGGAVIPPLT